ncbi:putative g-patch dna repair protein [Erysiphe neolycopersici]|uniref:Putative g-patch dna repair protein n=1 Tax=Erysiphe neolycopersici TaxID=212602 RepID=A0A420HKS2_9PEZI|nr:putative g-patch dna repair protein [Erysiphe neolycopersici]
MSGSTTRGGLSLYANLLDSDTNVAPEVISKGPITFKSPQTSSESKKPLIDPAALRFQPTKRPHLTQKPKPKPSITKNSSLESRVSGNFTSQAIPSASITNTTKIVKSSLADWTNDRDEDAYYNTEKRQRGGRRKKKKNKENILMQDWDDIYDPNRPNNFEEYQNSDEKLREIREWKDRLYAHREAKRFLNRSDSEEENIGHAYAPPSNYNFAPPPIDGSPKLSNVTHQKSPSAPPSPSNHVEDSKHPSAISSSSITRAPIHYTVPPDIDNCIEPDKDIENNTINDEEKEIPNNDEDAPKSRRPGQKKFAERLMSKYGWSKGKGLGAEESGIINPLQVKLEKRKKKSDAEGGGFRDAGNRGKIIGGKQGSTQVKDQDIGKFGSISEVILLNGMVDETDLDEEVERGGGGDLMQEIGDECSEKYGRVERVYIHRTGAIALVFVKFTSQLSALRAVNALEGRIFNGKTITAQFFDSSKFENRIYE